jgi:transposase
LIARGERVVRVAPKLTTAARDSARERGKSDAIDAVSIARAAIREGLDTLPVAALAGAELDIRLLVDHRERLVGTRTRLGPGRARADPSPTREASGTRDR